MAVFRRRVLFLALAIGTSGLLANGWWSFHSVTEAQRTFDRATWLAAPTLDASADPGCYRGGMALDLVRSERLIGKHSQYAEHLLGAPEGKNPHVWRYPIGQCTGFGWHNTDLLLHLDSAFMVKRVELQHVTGL
jgi:hypothetical protein